MSRRDPRPETSARAEPIADVLDRALSSGDPSVLFDRLERGSRLPGPRPNYELANEVAQALAAARGRGDGLVKTLLASPSEFHVVTGALALAQRWERGIDPRGASHALEALCEDARTHVRAAVVEALRVLIGARGNAAIEELATWMDGYLGAHTVLEAIADRALLSRVSDGAAVAARLDEAFDLADASPRAHERSQGVRTLRKKLPAQIGVLGSRFSEVVEWLATKTAVKRPESREVVDAAIRELERWLGQGRELDALRAALEQSGKPPRDPTAIVEGTRQRGKRKRTRGR